MSGEPGHILIHSGFGHRIHTRNGQPVAQAAAALPPRPSNTIQMLPNTGHTVLVRMRDRTATEGWTHTRNPEAPLGSFENPYPYEARSIYKEEERQLERAKQLSLNRPPANSNPATREPESTFASGAWPNTSEIKTEIRPTHPSQRQYTIRDEDPKRHGRLVHFRESPNSKINGSPDTSESKQAKYSGFRHVRPFAPTEGPERKRERHDQPSQDLPLGATPGQNWHRGGHPVHSPKYREEYNTSPPLSRSRRRSSSHSRPSEYPQPTMRSAYESSQHSGPTASSERNQPSPNMHEAEFGLDGIEIWPNCTICQAKPAQVNDGGLKFCFGCYGEARAMDAWRWRKDGEH